MISFLRTMLNWQFRLSNGFDQLLPKKYRIDGHDDFRDNILPMYIDRDMLIYDVGGGRRPYVDTTLKRDGNLKVIGVDIDADELESAPKEAYDSTICADLTKYRGRNDADLVICQATLEHVQDTEEAFAALATIAKPGGLVAVFVPSRNAVFARLNLLLPQRLKRSLLSNVFGDTMAEHAGFKAYYNRCTPKEFAEMAEHYGFEIERENLYFSSRYFTFFVPAHVLWRIWLLIFHTLASRQSAETFVMVLRLVNQPADQGSRVGEGAVPESGATAASCRG